MGSGPLAGWVVPSGQQRSSTMALNAELPDVIEPDCCAATVHLPLFTLEPASPLVTREEPNGA